MVYLSECRNDPKFLYCVKQKGMRMKVLISDYPDSMMPDHTLEMETLRAGLGEDVDIEVYAYADDAREEFFEHLRDADALLTAFVHIDKEAFEHAPHLKVIAINATGYDNVDMKEATARNVGVCPVGEYCTWDVSEAAVAYMYALNKHFKFYQRQIEQEHRWDYAAAPEYPRIEDQTVGIIGFGKIGKCTAGKIKGLVNRVLVNDIRDEFELAESLGVIPAEVDQILAESDVIINHMNLNETNYRYFDAEKFGKMKKHPIVINLGRGLCVDEDALIKALDSGQIRAFGADVLYDETPDLAHHPLVGRDNVIITPHSAFYSSSSLRDLIIFSTQNIVHYLTGQKDKLFKLVNDTVEVRDVVGHS